MPQRDSAPIGAPVWADLFTTDPDRSRAFYEELFGWTSKDAGEEYGGYINFAKDGLAVAGAMRNDGQSGTPDRWSVYLATDDAKATVDSAVAHGAAVIVPAMEVGELGSMAVVTDPGQAAIGAWQPGLHRGFGLLAETDAPAWFELLTRDYDASVAFYQDVFKWDTSVVSDTPEFRYTALGEGEAMMAGIMDASGFLPAGETPTWSVYFGAENADATLARIVALGGAIVTPAEDTPYGHLAQASDPTGALFKIRANS